MGDGLADHGNAPQDTASPDGLLEIPVVPPDGDRPTPYSSLFVMGPQAENLHDPLSLEDLIDQAMLDVDSA
jgi:hypothetical protein